MKNLETEIQRPGRVSIETSRHHGATLVWLVVGLVTTLIAIVMVVPLFCGYMMPTRGASSTISGTLNASLELYRLHIGDYPESLRALVDRTAAEKPYKWQEPYVSDPNFANDAWGRPFSYQRLSKDGKHGYRLVGAGPDGVIGTADDQVISELD